MKYLKNKITEFSIKFIFQNNTPEKKQEGSMEYKINKKDVQGELDILNSAIKTLEGVDKSKIDWEDGDKFFAKEKIWKDKERKFDWTVVIDNKGPAATGETIILAAKTKEEAEKKAEILNKYFSDLKYENNSLEVISEPIEHKLDTLFEIKKTRHLKNEEWTELKNLLYEKTSTKNPDIFRKLETIKNKIIEELKKLENQYIPESVKLLEIKIKGNNLEIRTQKKDSSEVQTIVLNNVASLISDGEEKNVNSELANKNDLINLYLNGSQIWHEIETVTSTSPKDENKKETLRAKKIISKTKKIEKNKKTNEEEKIPNKKEKDTDTKTVSTETIKGETTTDQTQTAEKIKEKTTTSEELNEFDKQFIDKNVREAMNKNGLAFLNLLQDKEKNIIWGEKGLEEKKLKESGGKNNRGLARIMELQKYINENFLKPQNKTELAEDGFAGPKTKEALKKWKKSKEFQQISISEMVPTPIKLKNKPPLKLEKMEPIAYEKRTE